MCLAEIRHKRDRSLVTRLRLFQAAKRIQDIAEMELRRRRIRSLLKRFSQKPNRLIQLALSCANESQALEHVGIVRIRLAHGLIKFGRLIERAAPVALERLLEEMRQTQVLVGPERLRACHHVVVTAR